MKKNILIIIIFNLLTGQQSLKNQKGFPYNNSNYDEDHYNQKNKKELSEGLVVSNQNTANSTIFIGALVFIVVIVGGIAWWNSGKKDSAAPGQGPLNNSSNSSGNSNSSANITYEELFDQMFDVKKDSFIPIYFEEEKQIMKIEYTNNDENCFYFGNFYINFRITKKTININFNSIKKKEDEILTYLKSQNFIPHIPNLFKPLISKLSKFTQQISTAGFQEIFFDIKDNQMEKELINILNTIKNNKYFNFYKLFEEKLLIENSKEITLNSNKIFISFNDHHNLIHYKSNNFELGLYPNKISIEIYQDQGISKISFTDLNFLNEFTKITHKYNENKIFDFILNLTKHEITDSNEKITFNIIDNNINPQDLINLLNIIEEKQ